MDVRITHLTAIEKKAIHLRVILYVTAWSLDKGLWLIL